MESAKLLWLSVLGFIAFLGGLIAIHTDLGGVGELQVMRRSSSV